MGPVAGGVGILSLVARMVACNIIVFGSVPCCADVGAGADVGADADADDGDGDGDAFSPNVDGECAVHVSVFYADTGPVEVDADAGASADADDADGDADASRPMSMANVLCTCQYSFGCRWRCRCLQYQCRWRMCCARVWI